MVPWYHSFIRSFVRWWETRRGGEKRRGVCQSRTLGMQATSQKTPQRRDIFPPTKFQRVLLISIGWSKNKTGIKYLLLYKGCLLADLCRCVIWLGAFLANVSPICLNGYMNLSMAHFWQLNATTEFLKVDTLLEWFVMTELSWVLFHPSSNLEARRYGHYNR